MKRYIFYENLRLITILLLIYSIIIINFILALFLLKRYFNIIITIINKFIKKIILIKEKIFKK